YAHTQVAEVVRRRRSGLAALAAALRMLRCVLANRHFRFVEGYLHQVLPAVLSVCMARTLSGEPFADHWRLRDDAADILAVICKSRFQSVQPQVQPRLSGLLASAFKDPASPPPTRYGAAAGLAALGPHAAETLLVPLLRD
ncbi:unnamed protein product, partial [Phaeothamnion confervicola]